MTRPTTLLAPVDLATAERVGPRLYRKQILRKQRITYPAKTGPVPIDFDDGMMTDLAAAFADGAYDNVPFQLADASNTHTLDPMRLHGWVKGVEQTPDGMDAIIEVSPEADELIQRSGGKLGVSARIKHAVEHVDGRKFKRAIHHVLGTLDPRMTGMRGWEPVDLATPGETVVDLSDYQEGATAMPTPPITLDLSTLDDDQLESFSSWAALNGIDLAEPEGGDDEPADEPADEPEGDEPDEGDDDPEDEPAGDDEPEGISDDEVNALIDAELAAIAGAELADENQQPDLVTADLSTPDEPSNELADLRFDRAANQFRKIGVPPYAIELARPVLSLGVDEIDLAAPDGTDVDVHKIVVGLLGALKGTVDLAREDGYGHDGDQADETADLATRWSTYLDDN